MSNLLPLFKWNLRCATSIKNSCYVIAHFYKSGKHKQTIINLLALPGRITYTFQEQYRWHCADGIVTSTPTRLIPTLEHFQNSNWNAPHLFLIRIGVGHWQDAVKTPSLKPQWVHKTGCAASALYAIVQGVAAHRHYNRKSSSMSNVIISFFMTEDRSGRSLTVISWFGSR